MKKTALLIPLVALGLLASCGGSSSSEINIGVCQLATHEALDAATRGFKETLEKEFGNKVNVEVQVAAGDPATCSTIVNNFVSKKKDLIMANATPAVQSAAQATSTIPILGTSVTEYGVALDIPNFSGVTGINVSGTSDLAPLKEQAKMITEVFPRAQKVGLFYCSAEANSKYQIDEVERELTKYSVETTRISFSDSNDIASVLNANLSKVDLIYIPTDNKAADNAQIINDICLAAKKPVFAGEENMCKTCGAITLSIDYYNIGVKTGLMAIDILKNGANIKTMPIAYDESPVKKFNKAICEELGINVPSDYQEIK